MANKPMWDWMDKAEGRKDSSFDNANKERARQGVKPMQGNAVKTPSYAEAQELIKKEGGYANAHSPHAINRYAADELGHSLNMNPKFLYDKATEKGIDLREHLRKHDAATDTTKKLNIGFSLMNKLVSDAPMQSGAKKLRQKIGGNNWGNWDAEHKK